MHRHLIVSLDLAAREDEPREHFDAVVEKPSRAGTQGELRRKDRQQRSTNALPLETAGLNETIAQIHASQERRLEDPEDAGEYHIGRQHFIRSSGPPLDEV